ncbi:uncharacterized protein LOC133824056 [Humulus lupulus]|uniref:uncharacterized protein LOC133824056 n=1 Tax=Humulus lupulus TaxID=3486 RepID=UPI002B408080|nr:uncharacterized protein LOC133824056 [Humulus lupulus]
MPQHPPLHPQVNPPEAQSDMLNHFMTEKRSSIKSLEIQIGQLEKLMSNRAQGNLPSSTEVNPKEQCNAISLRSGKKLEEPSKKPIQLPKVVDEKKGKIIEEVNENFEKKEPKTSIEHHIKIPYPQRFQKKTLDKQFSKFLDVFRKLHINIYFAKALEQMKSYVKFMKEILSKKREFEDYEMVSLIEDCSAILQKKLPPKLKDPGSFNIPCSIGGSVETKALCDLGVSINLTPLSIFRKLKLGKARPTTVSLQMADRSIKHSRGIIEDVLVKVDKFIFPIDFIILDMEEDENISIILGRAFLATGRALIAVQKGELKLRVQKEGVTFKVFAAMEVPNCCRVDVVENEGDKMEVIKKKTMVKGGK